jgi:hypothetical protein
MPVLRKNEALWKWFKDLSPAFFILAFSLVFQLYWGSHPFPDIWRVTYRVFFRFFRYAISLCLPLLILGPIYTSILRKKSGNLIQVDPAEGLNIGRIKHWIYRPFQGIGISFLFATKLLAVIQIVSGPSIGSAIPFTPGHFNLGKLLVSSAITAGISLLLSIIWTFDDLGVRYYNRRDQELKMIGKYLGTLMPTIFGIYGIFSLHAQNPGERATVHVLRIVIALYPSLVVFVVAHNHFLNKRRDYLTGKVYLTKGGVRREEG